MTRRGIYKKWIMDVALDLSQYNPWRKILFDSEYDKKLLIDATVKDSLPARLGEAVIKGNLKFYASKMSECPKDFSEGFEGAAFFKFESMEFPDIVRYTAN